MNNIHIDTAYSIIDTLSHSGCTTFCIAPGARSTPLALAAFFHPASTTHVHFDERGLSFFALGISKQKQEPVAVIVTSGSAVGNCVPCAMEAFNSKTPLIFISADRPSDKHNCGSNQTISHACLKEYVSFYQEILFSKDTTCETASRLIEHALSYVYNEKKPIHINVQVPEDAIGNFIPSKKVCRSVPPWYWQPSSAPLSDKSISFLISALNQHTSILCIVGQDVTDDEIEFVQAIVNKKHSYVYCDILSSARSVFKSLYVPTPFAEKKIAYDITPTLVVHVGNKCVSKELVSIIERSCPHEYIYISDDSQVFDPHKTISTFLQGSIGLHTAFIEKSLTILPQTEHTKNHTFDIASYPSEALLAHRLSNEIAIKHLFIGNSLLIRHFNSWYFPSHPVKIYAQRGVSGIDGNIASISGLSYNIATIENFFPLLAIIGDQTFLADISSLPLLKKSKARLIVVNNYGGQIFSKLALSGSQALQTHFVNNHSFNFKEVCSQFDITHTIANTVDECLSKLKTETWQVIELCVKDYL